jgi:hypothetical protein
MQVNRIKDFVERVVWTAVQAAAAAALATGFDNWNLTGKVAGLAALAAALKVVIAQNIGTRGSGDAIPGGVVETGKG